MSNRLFCFCSLLCAAILVGCDQAPELGHVTGTVTMDGKPLGEVRVLFVPEPDDEGEGIYSDCYTGEDGKYDLIYSSDSEVRGATVGPHTVAVEDAQAEESRGSMAIRVPDRFSSAVRSPLKFDVKTGENTYDIEIPRK